MTHNRSHSFIRSFILLGFTVYLSLLLYTGDIYYYLAPRLHMLAYVTAGILALLTLVSLKRTLFSRDEHEHDHHHDQCGCSHSHTPPTSKLRSFLVYGLFILPLVLGFCLPNKFLTSAIAEQKGINLPGGVTKQQQLELAQKNANQSEPTAKSNSPTTASVPVPKSSESKPATGNPQNQGSQPKSDQQIHAMFNNSGFGDFYTDIATSMYKQQVINLDDKTFLDGLAILDLFLDEFNQRKLQTKGFVYRDSSFQSDQFVVARFSISCCTADATVSGVMVQFKDAKKLPKDSWVQVKGILQKMEYEGAEMLVLQAEEVKPIQAPKDPYVYYSTGNPPVPNQ